MSYEDDKRELLKLKQGLIEESETIKEEKPEKIVLHGAAWWKNFFYHYKIRLIVGALLVALFTVMFVQLFSKEQRDLRVIIAGSNSTTSSLLYLKTDDIEKAVEEFCPDYSNNGSIHVETYYIDLSNDKATDMFFANQAKLYGELSIGVAQIIIGNKGLFESVFGDDEPESMFMNLEELYPDNPNIEGVFYKMKGSALAEAAHWEASCPEDMYICIRGNFPGLVSDTETMTRENEHSLAVLDNIINSIKVNE